MGNFKSIRIILFTICIFFYAISASAGAWLQKAQTAQIINTTNYYYSDKVFSSGGSSKSSNIYSKIESSTLIEYGLNDELTLGINPVYQQVEQQFADFAQKANSFTNLNLFYRKKLNLNKNIVTSYQPLLKIPFPYNPVLENSLGERQFSFELRFLAGKNIKLDFLENTYLHNALHDFHFINGEIAWRYNFQDKTHELRIDASLGIKLKRNYELTSNIFTIFTIANSASEINTNFQVQESGFDLIKIQSSIRKKINKKIHLELFAFKDVWGRKTGNGLGGGTSIWYKF